MVLSVPTRWSTDFFMVRRMIRMKAALVCAAVDEKLVQQFNKSSNADVKKALLDDECWANAAKLNEALQPLCKAIQFCEGDNVPVSVVPHIWQFLSLQLSAHRLQQLGWSEESANDVAECVVKRRDMNITPLMLASYVLDARFHDIRHLSASEWATASNFIVDVGMNEQIEKLPLISELAYYRAKAGPLFSDKLLWEAVRSEACLNDPRVWWSAFAASSNISILAAILLGMSATAATVERCNKSYSSQKTKDRNRLAPTRAAKVSAVAYNLNIQCSQGQQQQHSINGTNGATNRKLCILTLPCCQEHYSSVANTGLDTECDDNNSASIADIGEESEHSESDESSTNSDDDTEADAHNADPCTENDSDGTSCSADEDAELTLTSVPLLKGDWVAVKLLRENSGKSSSTRRICHSDAFMHFARVEDIDENGTISVSFVKKQADGTSYCWPDSEDSSTVDRSEVIKIQSPTESIISGASTRVRVRMTFWAQDIEAARLKLNIPLANIK